MGTHEEELREINAEIYAAEVRHSEEGTLPDNAYWGLIKKRRSLQGGAKKEKAERRRKVEHDAQELRRLEKVEQLNRERMSSREVRVQEPHMARKKASKGWLLPVAFVETARRLLAEDTFETIMEAAKEAVRREKDGQRDSQVQ